MGAQLEKSNLYGSFDPSLVGKILITADDIRQEGGSNLWGYFIYRSVYPTIKISGNYGINEDPAARKDILEWITLGGMSTNTVIGTFTGNMSGAYGGYGTGEIIGYEIEFFNPQWGKYGDFIYKAYLGIEKEQYSTITNLDLLDGLKNYLAIPPKGYQEISARVLKNHYDRSGGVTYFPHFDPDYPVSKEIHGNSSVQYWDEYFGNQPFWGIYSFYKENADYWQNKFGVGPGSGESFLIANPWNTYAYIPSRELNSTLVASGSVASDGSTYFNKDGISLHPTAGIARTEASLSFAPRWQGGYMVTWGICWGTNSELTLTNENYFDFSTYTGWAYYSSLGVPGLERSKLFGGNNFLIKNLTANTKYYVRAWQKRWGNPILGENPDIVITKYDTVFHFTTPNLNGLPMCSTQKPNNITGNSASFWCGFMMTSVGDTYNPQNTGATWGNPYPKDDMFECGVIYSKLGIPSLNGNGVCANGTLKVIAYSENNPAGDGQWHSGLNEGGGDYMTLHDMSPSSVYTFRTYIITKARVIHYSNPDSPYCYQPLGGGRGDIVITTAGNTTTPKINIVGDFTPNSTIISVGYQLESTGNWNIPWKKRGVCFSTSPNPTIALDQNNEVIETNVMFALFPESRGDTMAAEYVDVEKLTPGVKYYFRAFAVYNDTSIAYSGQQIKDTPTKKTILEMFTLYPASLVTTNSASIKFDVKTFNSYFTQMGVCYSLNPTIAYAENGVPASDLGIGSKTISLSGLTPNSKYYYKVYFKDADGEQMTSIGSFNTSIAIQRPSFSLQSIIKTSTQVPIKVIVSSNGGEACDTWIDYDKATLPSSTIKDAKAVKVSTGTGVGTFTLTLDIANLEVGVYNVIAYSKNASTDLVSSNYQSFEIVAIQKDETAASLNSSITESSTTAYVYAELNAGNSNVLNSSIAVSAGGVNFTNDSVVALNNAFQLNKVVNAQIDGLSPETNYTVLITSNTEYTQSHGGAVTQSKTFTTKPEVATGVTSDEPFVLILTTPDTNSNTASYILRISQAQLVSTYKVRLAISSSKKLLKTNPHRIIALLTEPINNKVVSFETAGTWYVQAILTAKDNNEYTSNIVEMNIGIDDVKNPIYGFYKIPMLGKKVYKGTRTWEWNGKGWARLITQNTENEQIQPTETPVLPTDFIATVSGELTDIKKSILAGKESSYVGTPQIITYFGGHTREDIPPFETYISQNTLWYNDLGLLYSFDQSHLGGLIGDSEEEPSQGIHWKKINWDRGAFYIYQNKRYIVNAVGKLEYFGEGPGNDIWFTNFEDANY